MREKETQLVNELQNKFNVKSHIKKERRIVVVTNTETIMPMGTYLKEKGFVHLSSISVTDWLKDKEYELTYHIWSYQDNILITLKTRISRKNPEIKSVVDIWFESAQIHERELHELYGVKFKGNNDLSPLFLEKWDGPAPFRKDFNWREYVRDEMYRRENEREKNYYEQ